MKEFKIHIPEKTASRIANSAGVHNRTPEEELALRVRHLYGSFGEGGRKQEAIAPARGQRPEARTDTRLDWWREAKFGMFIHWGLYAAPAGHWKGYDIPGIGEWIMYNAEIPISEYEKLADSFNPVKFDADEWVSLAKRAGLKYITITAKHHDGFCIFKSTQTDFNIVDATPFRRDPLKELADACARHDLKLCFYYSQTQDWHHPDGDGNDWDYDADEQDFEAYIDSYVIPQVKELLTNYGPVGLIWFDTPKHISEDQSKRLLDAVHSTQPECLVCGRLGNALGDYASAGDNKIPAEAVEGDWETPATINDTWGFKTNDHNWKSKEDLIRKLIDIVSKGGNYLLNVGPTAEGVIPGPSVERLEAMGAWLEKNGDSIYDTVPGPVQGVSWCRSTQRENTVFLQIFDWPEGGAIDLPGLTPKAARILSSGENLSIDGSTIHGPSAAPDSIASVIAVEV